MARTYFLYPPFAIDMRRIMIVSVDASGVGEGDAEALIVLLAEAIASGIGEAIASGIILPRKICVTLSIDGRETTLEIQTRDIDLSVTKREIELSLKKFLNNC